jgi:hypothetical protein
MTTATEPFILLSWHCFPGARTQHQVCERMGTKLLTTCGQSWSETEAKPGRGKQCGSCRRYRRDK